MAQTPFSLDTVKKIRTIHLERAKAEGEKFSMLTCYDFSTAQVFDRAGIEMLLIGDSAANVMLGYDSTLAITLDEIIPMVAAVSRGAKRAMVVAVDEEDARVVLCGLRVRRHAFPYVLHPAGDLYAAGVHLPLCGF